MRVRSLHVYPLKGGRAIDLARATVGARGIEHDRRFMIVDGEGRFVTQRTSPELARTVMTIDGDTIRFDLDGGRPLVTALRPSTGARRPVVVWRDTCDSISLGVDAARWFEARLGFPCDLVYMPDDSNRQVDVRFARAGDVVGFADGYPVLLASMASLDDVSSHLASPVPMNRFRPSVVIDGGHAWQEDAWRRVRIGDVELRVVKGCARCVVTTVDQLTGESGREPLKTLAKIRNFDGDVIFGQNAIPDGGGEIAIGDEITVIERA